MQTLTPAASCPVGGQPSSSESLSGRFHDFVARTTFPCVGAKSALARGRLETFEARAITSAWDDLAIAEALLEFAVRHRDNDEPFHSLAILFEGPRVITETQFETAMWQRLQSLSDKDAWFDQPVDHRVSTDPADPDFALSFGGEAFFAVGLHPGASRPARRFEVPAIVFNRHAQFRTLRAEGRYEKLRAAIIGRDEAQSGSVNPMLSRHGEQSEARQYSGRAVGGDWQCPFQRRE